MLDWKQTPEGDIDLSGGDITLTEPTEQHQRDMLSGAQGWYKESPEAGVDSIGFLSDGSPDDYLRTVRKQAERDGFRVRAIGIDRNGELTIDGAYENS